MNDTLVQTAIDLVFVFGVAAGAVAALTEGISRYIGLRAEYVLRGIRTSADGPTMFKLPVSELLPWSGRRVSKRDNAQTSERDDAEETGDDIALVALIMSHPLVASAARNAKPPQAAGDRAMTNKERRTLPTSVSGQTFARALIDILLVQLGSPGDDPIDDPITVLRAWASKPRPAHEHVAGAMRPVLTGARDMEHLEERLANWYDGQMANVNLDYKRHVGWITLGVAVLLVLAFNINAIRIGQATYNFQSVQASCGARPSAACLQSQVALFRAVGWGAFGIGSLRAVVITLAGWALMVAALVPGSRFWFGQISRLAPAKTA